PLNLSWFFRCLARAASFHQRDGGAFLHDLSLLVEYLPMPGDDTASTTGPALFLEDARTHAHRVAGKNRPAEAPFPNGHEGQRAHQRSLHRQAAYHGQHQQSMGDGTVKRSALREFVIDVDRIEIAADSGEVDDVSLGDRAAHRIPFLTDFHILKVQVRTC